MNYIIFIRPYPPELTTAEVRCRDQSPLMLYGSIEARPRWEGYDITEFRINVTNGSTGEVLKQDTIKYNGHNVYHYFNQTLNELSGCVDPLNNSSILISATVFSITFGESLPSQSIEARVSRGNYSNHF